MRHEQISQRIKECEEELGKLRKELEEKKYPYFAKGHDGLVILFTGPSTGIVVVGCSHMGVGDTRNPDGSKFVEGYFTPCEIQVKP